MGNVLEPVLKFIPDDSVVDDAPLNSDEAKCGVCTRCFSAKSNIVCCTKCGVQVDHVCAGIDTNFDGEWFCDPCSWGQNPKNLCCYLCNVRGSKNILMGIAECKKWAHAACITWIDGKIKSSMKKCGICHAMGENLLPCCFPSCKSRFHAHCMLLENPRKSVCCGKHMQQGTSVSFHFCAEHAHQVNTLNVHCLYPIEDAPSHQASTTFYNYVIPRDEIAINALKTAASISDVSAFSAISFAIQQLCNVLDACPIPGLRHVWVVDCLMEMTRVGRGTLRLRGILDENLLADTSNGLEEALLRVDLALARILLTGGFQDLGEYCPLELEVTSRKCAAKMHGLRSSIAPIVERRRLSFTEGKPMYKFERMITCVNCMRSRGSNLRLKCSICGILFHSEKCAAEVAVLCEQDLEYRCHICFNSKKLADAMLERNLSTVYKVLRRNYCADPSFQDLYGDTPSPLHIGVLQSWYEGLSMVLFFSRIAFADRVEVDETTGMSKMGFPPSSLPLARIKDAEDQPGSLLTPLQLAHLRHEMACAHILRMTYFGIDSETRMVLFRWRSESKQGRDISCGQEAIEIPWINEVDDEAFPSHRFTYVTRIVEGRNVFFDWMLTGSIKACKDKKNNEKCTIANCQNHSSRTTMQSECTVLCSCYKINPQTKLVEDCGLRASQVGLKYRLQAFKHGGKYKPKGWGIRALEHIPKGVFLCVYAGEIVTQDVYDRREHRYTLEGAGSYGFYLDKRNAWVIDATHYRNFAAFFNHACGGCNLKPVCIIGETGPETIVSKGLSGLAHAPACCGFETISEIEPLQELTFYYDDNMPRNLGGCLCGPCNLTNPRKRMR